MIIGKANEVLSNPRLRAEHDFMIDYQNVINITQEINTQNNTYQTQTTNQRSDKKYYRTNAGYTPTQHETLKHTDKPIWTMFGMFISFLGLFMFIYIIAAHIYTEPIKTKYISYNSKIGRIRTDANTFFCTLSDNDLAKIYELEITKQEIYIVADKSILANFYTSTKIEPVNIYVQTIEIYTYIFSTIGGFISLWALYFKKKDYYLFIKITTLNTIVILFLMIMIL